MERKGQCVNDVSQYFKIGKITEEEKGWGYSVQKTMTMVSNSHSTWSIHIHWALLFFYNSFTYYLRYYLLYSTPQTLTIKIPTCSDKSNNKTRKV